MFGDRRVALLRQALDGPHPRGDLRRVAKLFREERFAAGAELCRAGEIGREAWLLVEGRVQVRSGRTQIANLGPGEFVGEMALLESVPRTATVTAITPLHVLTIDAERFPKLMARRSLKQRLESAVATREKPKKRSRTSDPDAWKLVLEAARRDRARRRRVRLVATTAVTIVLLLIAGIGIRMLADRSTPVPLNEAVARFRQAAAMAPLAAPIRQGTSAGEPQPEAEAKTQPARVAATAERRALPVTVAEQAARPVPADGVYVYKTSGWEEISALGGSRHTYPAETTITVSSTACGLDLRWDGLEERWDRYSLCLSGRGLEVQRYTTFHEFYEKTDERTFTCTKGLWLRPDDGVTSFAGRCADRMSTADVKGSVVGVEDVVVAGSPVKALRVRAVQTLSGGSTGTKTDEGWFALDTGHLLRFRSSTDAESDSPIGRTTYREELSLDLTSLEPLR